MARNRRLILSPPAEVWRLLSDGHRYGEWVTGNQQVLAVDPDWPAVGAALRFRVGIGPLTTDDTSIVRICEPEHRLELEAKADPFGAARVAMKLIPWGEHTLFVLDWHPLRGPGTRMHGLPVDYLVKVRNGMMLTKLARIAVAERAPDARSSAAAASAGSPRSAAPPRNPHPPA
ncbi:SRPBCC family protein [Streptomyces sp. NPDC059639]|uniref:SRPBCC family protein n=1 Tax=Streptomyces sp. NPDC059639 TaxID=3346891 RepID=UPI0036B9107F